MELITIEQAKVKDVFTPNGVDKLYNHVAKQVEEIELDVSTPSGRKIIASTAYNVAKSKTYAEKFGKALSGELKKEAKKVDAARKMLRDRFDALRDKIRKPLTEWEEAEKERLEAIRLQQEIDRCHEEALEMNDLFDREREIARKEAELAKAEEERLAREAAEKAERERKEREERIAKEAAERAKREAQEKIEAERRAKEEAERKAKEEIERSKREAKEAEELAERKRIEALKQAEFEKQEAVRKAKEDAERKERERLEMERIEKEKAERRARHASHRKRIIKEVSEHVFEHIAHADSPMIATESLVAAMVAGHIEHVKVIF